MKNTKKFLLTLLIVMSPINLVSASEHPEITEDVEIRYKWYKEVVEGDYYPLKEETEGYIVDKNNIKYGPYSYYTESNCSLPDKYYLKEYKLTREYKTVADTRYVKLENFTYNNNIKIYHENRLVNFEVLANDNNTVKIDLKKNYRSDTLTFFIENSQNYTIGLYTNKEFTSYIISKQVTDEKLLIPDGTWITKNTSIQNLYTELNYKESELTKKVREYNVCRYREIYAYKYKINKEYYDDNYYAYVEGYMKDSNNYKVFYKGEPITNTIEIIKEKIVKEPITKYIYKPDEPKTDKNNTDEIQPEIEQQKNDSSEEMQEIACIPKIQTKFIEKEIIKTPKIAYIIIAILLLIAIILSIKLTKKNVD